MKKFLFIALATILLSGTQPAEAGVMDKVKQGAGVVKHSAVAVKNTTVKVVKYVGSQIKAAAQDIPKDVLEAIAVIELVPIFLLAL